MYRMYECLERQKPEKGHPRLWLPASLYLLHPCSREHRRSLPSMATRHTIHPEHKKTLKFEGLLQHYTIRMLFK